LFHQDGAIACKPKFDQQDSSYRDAVPGKDTVSVGVEAAVHFGWNRYLGAQVQAPNHLYRLSGSRTQKAHLKPDGPFID